MNTMPGYELLTNIENQHADIYHNTARAFNLDYAITIYAYDKRGEIVRNHKGFYVKNDTGNLSMFWKAIQREMLSRRATSLC